MKTYNFFPCYQVQWTTAEMHVPKTILVCLIQILSDRHWHEKTNERVDDGLKMTIASWSASSITA